MTMFDLQKTPLKIDKPIRLIELFAGVGSQAKALERLGANFEHYRISEWEVNAAASYKAIHKGDDSTDYSAEFSAEELTEILFNIGISTDGKKPLGMKEIARKNEQWKRTVFNNFKATNNVGSILNIKGCDLGIVDTDKFCYILTYSFPCQDLSLAGKGNGMAKGSGTRSGLLWEVERLLNECDKLPQILLMENVTQVHGSKNKEHFEEWIAFLESKGYSNYWKDLNAKNFGIPQNRNRTFMVSVLGGFSYEFPKEFPLKFRLKDMLETDVDEKFYLSNEQMGKIVNWKAQQKPFERVLGRESIVQTITARGAGENHSGMIVFSSENENTTNMQSQVKEITKNIVDPFICASRGRNPENPSDRRAGIPTEQRLEVNFSGCSNTLTTVQKDNYVVEPFIKKIEIPQMVRVRKFEVDCKLLCAMLRAHKQASKLSNKDIAEQLNVPLTNVEHWFRQDNGFSIPDANIWFDLKGLLCIETSEFDEAITTFEEKEGVFEKSNRCYFSDGIAPTITSASANEKVIEPSIHVVGNYSPSGHDASRIVDGNGLAPTVKENHGTVTAVVEPLAYDEQNGYIRKDGIVGTLTTDGSSPKHNNRVVEPLVWEQRADDGLRFFKGDYSLKNIDACGDKMIVEDCHVKHFIKENNKNARHQQDLLQHHDDICRCLPAGTHGSTPHLTKTVVSEVPLRIRKLTPKECWRLMGFDDTDFEKAAAENSNTQLYKQAGNSIVVDVLYYIFKNMFGGA